MRETKRPTPKDFEAVYKKYPKRPPGSNMGKATGMTRLRGYIQSWSTFEVFERAVKSIASAVERGDIDSAYVPMWSTFANRYKDYLPENLSDGGDQDFDDSAGMV